MSAIEQKNQVLDTIMGHGPVIAVLIVEDAHSAVPLAQALVAGGVRVLEFTLRTAGALDAVRAVCEAVPEAVVGTGTVLTPALLDASARAGAAFAVSPGMSPRLLAAAADHALPLLPGAATASEVMALLEAGYTRQKFFPAEAAGGTALLGAFASPLPAVQFCPTGGIRENTASRWLALPNVRCVGGSWLAPAADIESRSWAAITERARRASALVAEGK